MRHKVLGLLTALALMVTPAHASQIRPILVENGSVTVPCDGEFYWTPAKQVYANVAKVFLFVSMSPNGVNGLDAILWSPAYGGWGALADVHLMGVTPSQAIQGQMERTFSPDRVWVSTVQAGIICWGGGQALVYAEVFVED